MNLMLYLSFHLTILMISRAFARPSASTYFCPRSTDAGLFLSGLFFVGCSGWEGSARGCRCSRIEAMRHVLDEKTGGVEVRR